MKGDELHDEVVRQEDDRPNAAAILWIAAVTVFVTVVSIVISGVILRRAEAELGSTPPRFNRKAPQEIGIVDQTLLAEARGGQRLVAEKRRQLERYEWVDKAAGTIRIPIGRAMDLILMEASR